MFVSKTKRVSRPTMVTPFKTLYINNCTCPATAHYIVGSLELHNFDA